MENLEIKVSKPLKVIIEVFKLMAKGMLSVVKFIATMISICVLLVVMGLFGVNGMMMMQVDNWYDNASEHFYYQYIGDNLLLIHTLGVCSFLVMFAILAFLFWLYIKNVED